MDEDDNQDEPINPSKGKRAAQWLISDSDDDVEEESEEGESDEDQLDGEENGEEEEEDEGSEEEDDDEDDEDTKPEHGDVGGTSADLAGMSSDEDAEKCPICLNSFSNQPVATPETCEHYFCLDCILEWAKNANSCPVDRIAFNNIYLRKCYGGKVMKMITVQKPVKEGQEETVDLDLEQTNCEVCGSSDREDRLLLCDGCDAGYHMECLTPPLDSVPVEEWFCPECEANNRNSRGLAEEVSDAESLPSTARGAPSRRHQNRATGPTRAIARTQQSERVRANVNRHRITQARSSQLAPTYLIQSTWLDETINAVVAGLNTAVYVRDLTPRARSRRKTVKRRRVKGKKTSYAKGKTGKSASTRVKRRRRRVRRTKSRKKLMVKKTAGPRERIASNLGIVKDKKSSSLPTVYRPSEHTLSNMRADIGAASLSIYGDPFDLDPFVEREENEQVHVTSLMEAKRRGISRSALRSHQPVARPVTASLSRGGMDVLRSGGGGGGGVVEAAPVPDLLGSILSGQSMLLMDSSDVIINRDGSLKSTKPTVTPSTGKPSSSKSNSSGDADAHIDPGMSPMQGDSSLSLHYNRDLSGSSHSSINRPLSQSTACSPPFTSSSVIHTKPSPYTDLPPRGHPRLQPPCPVRPYISSGHHETPRETPFSSIHSVPDSKSKGTSQYQTQPQKAPIKPMWVDVSELPRIPKIKREGSSVTNDGTSQDGGNRIGGNKGNSSDSVCRNNDYGMPKMGMNSLAGDKGRQQIVDHQKGRVDGQTPRHRPGGANSSPAFSNSFSSSSSSTDSSAGQPHYSSSSSSSSAVSFRINSSGNSWHSRRLNIASSSASGGNMQDLWKRRQDEAKKRQLHRDKQMLLASRTPLKKEQNSNNIYDPFNPTVSDSSSSDNETESSSQDKCFRQVRHEVANKPPSSGNKQDFVQNKQDLIRVKMEMQETDISQEQPRRASSLENISQEVRCSEGYVKVEKKSIVVDTKVEKQPLLDAIIKKEPGLDETKEAERYCHSVNMYSNSEMPDTTPPAHHSLDLIKTEDTRAEECVQIEETRNMSSSTCRIDSSVSSSVPSKKKQMTESKLASPYSSKSPPRDLAQKKKTSKAAKEQHSSSSEMERGKRDHHTTDQGRRKKEKDKDKERSPRRSRSRERRRARSTSQSSLSSSPGRSYKKRRRSRSKDRKQSRSGSRSSSREYSRTKKHTQRSNERNDSGETDHKKRCMTKDKRRGQPRSKSRSRSRSTSRSKDTKRGRSRSKSRSRSRSKEKRKDHTQLHKPSLSHKVGSQSKDKISHRSRSNSRERRKEESKSSQKNSGSRVSSSKDKMQLQDKKKEKEGIQSSVKDENTAKWNKHESPSCTSISKVKNEGEDLRADDKPTTAEVTRRDMKVEIKKERKSSLDMFEDSPINKFVKKEEIDTFSLPKETKRIDEEIKEGLVKTQMCEIKTETCEIAIKCEMSSPKMSHLPTSTSLSILPTVTPECLQDAASQSHSGLKASEKQPSSAETTVAVKQEVLQPSDSDDDFSVDVMLDNLDYVKSERTEGGDAFVKQEKEIEEGKNEGAKALAGVGVKSKTQVKRVTWNIQEPEAPQSEKSASKVALYKLKRRQEGARRPSSLVHTASQEITGAVSDSSKKGTVAPPITSKFADLHPEVLSVTEQGEVDEGDKLMKDKYLKKLHMQERAIEEVKLAIKPFYQRRDINKEEYKEILRKAVQKVCHSKSGEINPVKVGNLVKAYVDKYKHARKYKKGEQSEKALDVHTEAMKVSESP